MKGKTYLLSGLIALFLLFGLITPQAAQARDITINAAPTLAFDPATTTATTCGTVDVNVRVNDVVDLTAYHLEVTYDRTKVQVLEVLNGGFLTDSQALPGLYEPTNTTDLPSDPTGRILFGMAQQGVNGDPVPKNGSGNLITIRLKSLAVTGTTTMTIDGTTSMLVDWPEAQSIGYTVAGGATITLQSCAPSDITLDNADVDENQPVGTEVGTLSATDPDTGDTTFTYSLVNETSYPDNASFQIVGDELRTNAIFNYEIKNSYLIRIRVTDPYGVTYDEAFTIAINDVNEAPVAQDQSVTTPEETQKAITLVATDVDGDELKYAIVSQPDHGTVTLVGTTGATATYTPALNYYGSDSFTFKANDGTADSNIATVTITVTEVKDQVEAVDDSYATYEDTPLTIAASGVLANDIDVDNNHRAASLVTNVQHGELSLLSDGSFTYVPDPGFFGTDTFVYQLVTYPDSPALQSLWTDEATVTITVKPLMRLFLPIILR